MFLALTFAVPEERDAFAYIYTQYKALMLRKAAAILHDEMLAEDAVSEAFIRIYRNMHKIEDPASGRCLAFVMTIVKNTALTLLEREHKKPVSLEEEDREDPFDLEQHVLSEISSEEILRILDGVSEELRSVFLLKYAYDLSHRQIGKLLGISENNVTVRLHRARKKIAAILIKEGYAVEKQS